MLAVCCLDAAGPKRPPQRLLEIGQYHHDEVWARKADLWLGLFRSNGEWAWRPVNLRLRRVPDILDDVTPLGWDVRVAEMPPEPVLLVQGLPELASQQVTTVYYRGWNPSLPSKSHRRSIQLGERQYSLELSNPKPWDGALGPGATLTLREAGVAQTLYALPDGGNDAGWSLHWAGDCDGDGRLDLYVTVTSHYNVAERRLYLSSKAKAGQLVGLFAEFVTVGC